MSLPDVLAQIRSAELAGGREPHSVRLIAVTKGRDLDTIREKVLVHGHFALAENKGQELRDKAQVMPEQEWHFIGPLQRNKIKYLKEVKLVHAIEEVWQAEALADAAHKWGKGPDLLLQMHNGESQKHGIEPENLRATLAQVRATGLSVRGLMVMAPYAQPTAAQQVFQEAAQRAHDLGLAELSMGMSDDFPIAIAAGATMVRVGRSLYT